MFITVVVKNEYMGLCTYGFSNAHGLKALLLAIPVYCQKRRGHAGVFPVFVTIF